MKLENQVCSFQLAKELYRLNVRKQTLFEWQAGGQLGGIQEIRLLQVKRPRTLVPANTAWSHYPALTVAELGQLLPTQINIPFKNGKPRAKNNTLKSYFGENSSCKIIYAKPRGVGEYLCEVAQTEADARAKMLIYLIERDLLKM